VVPSHAHTHSWLHTLPCVATKSASCDRIHRSYVDVCFDGTSVSSVDDCGSHYVAFF
jgi:hypothetical protein